MKLPCIKPVDRLSFIFNYVKDKSVLHVGCADMPFTQKKVLRGTLLHQRLLNITNNVTGVDVSSEGVSIMKAAAIPNVFTINGKQSLFEQLNNKFDIVIAGEVLEHVQNVGDLLESIRSVSHNETIIIITVPNFAPIKRIPRLLFKNEEVHPDHNYYFSYSTLSSLLLKANYNPIDWATYWRDVGVISKYINLIFKKFDFMQYYCDGFCVACKLD